MTVVEIAETIKAARKKKGLSQDAMARKLDVHEKTYRVYERGNCSIETLVDICNILDLQFIVSGEMRSLSITGSFTING